MVKNAEKPSSQAISDLGRQFSDTTILLHEAIARNAGLSGTDHKYLGLLMRQGAMTAGELATVTRLTTGAVTGLIDRLEQKGLVKRVLDKEDRRKIVIEPDYEKAGELRGPSFETLQSKMVQYISSLSDTETQIIEKYLNATIDIMKTVTNNLNQ